MHTQQLFAAGSSRLMMLQQVVNLVGAQSILNGRQTLRTFGMPDRPGVGVKKRMCQIGGTQNFSTSRGR